ncbi:MAG: NAD(P)H-dependent oxidoreductase [Candidatus Omnitrophota bacterium]
MKKAVIVFHSVCGNDYLMALKFREALLSSGFETGLYRVADAAWVEKPDLSEVARNNVRAMRGLPEATPGVLETADVIVLGSPTYFGNVSAPMKAFMDATGGLWIKGKLAGKKCAVFSSAGNPEGGGALCLQALQTYALYMGMHSVSVPVTTLPGENLPALGIIHYSNGKYGEVLDQKTQRSIEAFCAVIKAAV